MSVNSIRELRIRCPNYSDIAALQSMNEDCDHCPCRKRDAKPHRRVAWTKSWRYQANLGPRLAQVCVRRLGENIHPDAPLNKDRENGFRNIGLAAVKRGFSRWSAPAGLAAHKRHLMEQMSSPDQYRSRITSISQTWLLEAISLALKSRIYKLNVLPHWSPL